MIPNKFAYFSHGSTYRTNKEGENISDNSIVFVGDDQSIAARGKIFGVRGVYPGQEEINEDGGNTSTKIITTEPLFPVDTNGRPLVGTTISVRFRYTNSYKTAGSNMCLNVNGTGAYNIYYSGNDYISTTSANTTFCGYAGREVVYTFRIDVVDNVEHPRWVFVSHGYESGNTNTIGYQLRHNSSTLPASDKFYRYRLLFTSADGKKYVPANTSSSTNATASRTVNQRPIDPFGEILYYSSTSSVSAGSNPAATVLWAEYTLSLGYSFNRTGATLVLSYPAPVYIKCTPESDGSAIIDANTPYVQSLPSTDDGKIYIFLGIAYSATSIELMPTHPVYYHDGTGIRIWTGKDTDSNLFIVTVTKNDEGDNTTYSADKTFSEITEAFNAGKDVKVLLSPYYYNLYNFETGAEADFSVIIPGDFFCNEVIIYNDESIIVFDGEIQPALTFDSTPTANSTNPVESGGIYTALENKANINDLADVATSGSYNDLTDKPNIPTVPNIGTLNTNNSTAQTPSSSESFSGNINLHKVSKTGSYNDLTDTPNIPTILTVPVNSTSTPSGDNTAYMLGSGIQYANIIAVLDNRGEVVLKYGNKIYCLSKRENDSLTFSSLQGDDDNYSSFDIDSASRVNYHSGTIITSETVLSKGIPTGSGNAVTDIDVSGHQITLTKGTTFLTASDILGKADKSEAIGSLSLSLNTTDYKITLTGTYVDGTPFTVSDVIDLPLESVVVSGSYDPSTKKVVLTLKNNSTVKFSIADLISGLQSEITSSNKLSADLVEDGTNNKVFTATEKTKLSGIEAGAEVNVQSDWNQTNTSADDYVKNKPTIPNVGTLNTNNSTAQTVSSSESFSGSINLHKVSKTGSYNDLLNKPEIPEDTHQIVILVGLQETPLVFRDWDRNSLTHEQVAEIFSDPSKTVILYDNSSDVTYRYCGLFEQYYFSFIAPYSGGISYVYLVENPSTGIITVRKKGTVDYVPDTRKINNKRLSADITLTASEVGALPANTHIPVDPVNADWNSTGGLSEILNKPTIVQSVSINGGTTVSPDSTNGNVNLEGIVTGIYWGQHGIPSLNGIVTIPDNIVYGMLDNGLWYLGSYDTETGGWIYSESGSATGELSKIYVNVAPANKVETYVWTGTKFEEVISTSEYATESYVNAAIRALPTPMVFQGTIGTGGTSTTVPSNPTEGDTYKIISGGQSLTFSGITGTIRVGDTVIYKNSTVGWVLIPSGDDPSGTVTSVNMTVPTGLSVSGTPITSSGTLAVSFAAGYSIPTTAKQASWDQKQNAIEIIDLT